MIWASILSTVLAKYGLQHAAHKNWLPKNHYQRKAIECLKKSDIAGAVDNNLVVLLKDPDYEEARIVRELILMSIDTESVNLDAAIRKNTTEIEILKKSLTAIKIKHTAFTIIHSAILPVIVIFPFFLAIILSTESRTGIFNNSIFMTIYLFLVFLVGFVYMKYHLFHEVKSPVIRYRETAETIRYKISVYQKEVNKMQSKLQEYTRLRENTYSDVRLKDAK
ncbi:hypothetical protein AMJ80_08110 [bacterium SM23_31]|nr:MAG: hypothetical protein AMJ80_08110 [bacterium SM23_31]